MSHIKECKERIAELERQLKQEKETLSTLSFPKNGDVLRLKPRGFLYLVSEKRNGGFQLIYLNNGCATGLVHRDLQQEKESLKAYTGEGWENLGSITDLLRKDI